MIIIISLVLVLIVIGSLAAVIVNYESKSEPTGPAEPARQTKIDSPKISDFITIDDFKKVNLKVAKIIEAARVEGSEKLVKLQVSLGSEKRQVLAGIGKFYNPENLVGREIVIAANLEPRKLMGEESQGMILAAEGDSGEPIILVPEKEVPPGSGIR